jgi:CheY-like chemotaxis protein
VADTVLIAAPDLLSALTRREDLMRAVTFSDEDARAALDVITKQPPRLVALDRLFASTPRGAALIERIRRDPALAACEIRLVASDGREDERLPAAEPASPDADDMPGTTNTIAVDDPGTRIALR